MSSAATRPRSTTGKNRPSQPTTSRKSSGTAHNSSAKRTSKNSGAAGKPKTPTVALWLAGLGLGLVIGIQLATRSSLSGDGALLIELSRWAGL